ncbi:hypothetical protein BU24DRAFT_422738 [Aaosphaeria arxii CBS 175.79]|uniref:Secreted protein n=1 Tax=Aaosphaeria arxii CBS 175.79 TaxID=1450172 RepID=A0A6A5XU00_9PLEO|nr:uncharacterized protein BU24DRAFT_422738 [Aaosphaeria arxii CBS 175.79]KAF2016389.1 hypothetical protein BU24DRAFT_422738 [Aaosphaeria arxii CBS 175.79]
MFIFSAFLLLAFLFSFLFFCSASLNLDACLPPRLQKHSTFRFDISRFAVFRSANFRLDSLLKPMFTAPLSAACTLRDCLLRSRIETVSLAWTSHEYGHMFCDFRIEQLTVWNLSSILHSVFCVCGLSTVHSCLLHLCFSLSLS